jgi:DNA-binding Xre family transcriptional regulator
MNQHLSQAMFTVLKRTLRARGMTYADLAGTLAVSEPTIKRLFAAQDCKMSRMVTLCDALDLSIADVVGAAQRIEETPHVLSDAAEAAFARQPSLFYLYVLLRDAIPAEAIAEHYGLDTTDMYLYARDLENLGLVRIGVGGEIRLLSEAPMTFREQGPLQAVHQAINVSFMRLGLQQSRPQQKSFFGLSRRMQPKTAAVIRDEVDALMDRIAMLARQDQLTCEPTSLQAYKCNCVFAPAQFMAMFDVVPHPRHPRKGSSVV